MDDYAGYILVLALAGIFVFSLSNAFKKRDKAFLRSVVIVVLGDIGRSPRMMYHAESFATARFKTYVVGYGGSCPIPSLERLNVQLIHLNELPVPIRKLPFLILAPLKIIIQVASLLHTLLVYIPHPPEYIMVQNPPSIPTLALVQLVCWSRGSKLIIDWHNLGYSILALKLGKNHILVKIAKVFERYFGRSAFIHLFVTKAMRDHLVKEWNLQGIKAVLHDRPPKHFKRSELFEIHDLFNKLSPSLKPEDLSDFLPNCEYPRSTPLTCLTPYHDSTKSLSLDTDTSTHSSLGTFFPTLRSERPALLVSSTSWTPDEDFSLLLHALIMYERTARQTNESNNNNGAKLPKLLAIVTGKGPLKSYYMNELSFMEKRENWRWVRCRSLWLEAEDYPILLGSADLGVCLHSSSSALDLPMKVVDMFGCGLPVCALDFPCLPELVKDGRNGYTFTTGAELSMQLIRLLEGFPDAEGLQTIRSSFETCMSKGHQKAGSIHSHASEDDQEGWCSWEENWNQILKPLILRDADHRQTGWK
ncbi:glycosyltransferase family 33 [Pyrrhoderma noxium]|uniref:Chitobiosyldiphosphodolichol beta-mannosyltransferase n=1 Tax=Pyrrhoderma noxium TaxID=2282107 RepID=A0A286UQD2_9AGAM|nr:glycosyltransferase family 33 [Pyrrhoderma noxium]